MATTPKKSSFPSRLTELLAESKLTQEAFGAEVAKRLTERDDDFTQETVSRWKTGATKPKGIATVEAIADVFGVTVDFLLGRSEHRNGVPTLPVGQYVIDDVAYGFVKRGGKLPEDETWWIEVSEHCRLVDKGEYARMMKALSEKKAR